MIHLDGSYLEGGGQIIRTALSLSTLTKTGFEAYNIRKGRKQPGLKNQHLYAIRTLKEQCNAYVEGAELGSEKFNYAPRDICGGKIDVDIQTAGSITLVLQAILMPLLFADRGSVITLTGGTDTKWSQPVDYFNYILAPQLRKFCDRLDIRIMKRGYYPKGGGNVTVDIMPRYKLKDFSSFSEFYQTVSSEVADINLTEQGELVQIKGVSHASADLQSRKVADRQAEQANMLLKKFRVPLDIRVEYSQTLSTGSGITLWAIFSKNNEIDINNPVILGADALGEPGRSSEKVGEEAARRLIKEIESGTQVDVHLADNLVPWLIFGGQFRVEEMSNHTRTNVWVVNNFFKDKIEIRDKLILAH
jgi:RNA 3'-terminal phosphate cyclase (GTP)